MLFLVPKFALMIVFFLVLGFVLMNVLFLVLKIVLMIVFFLVLKIVLMIVLMIVLSGAQYCAHDCAFSGAQFCAHDCHSGLLRHAARVCEAVACASSGQTRQPCAPPQTTESETARVCEACGPRLLLYRPGNPRPKLRTLNLQPHIRTQQVCPKP